MEADDAWASSALEFKSLLQENADGFGLPQNVLDDLLAEEIIPGNSYDSLWWFLATNWQDLDRTAIIAAKLSDDRSFIKNFFR